MSLEAEQKAQQQQNAKAIHNTWTVMMGVSIKEILNFGVIFIMHFTKAFLDFMFNTAMRFVVFPFAAIYGLTKAGLYWRLFHLTRKDKQATHENKVIAFIDALWETLNSLGTTGAVITGIVGYVLGISVGMGISITFNFCLAMGTAICAAYAVYYAYTAKQVYKEWEAETDAKRRKELYGDYERRKNYAKVKAAYTGIVLLLTVGVTVAMVVGLPYIGAFIGLAGCLTGAVYTAYNLYKHLQPPEKKEEGPAEAESEERRGLLDGDELQVDSGISNPLPQSGMRRRQGRYTSTPSALHPTLSAEGISKVVVQSNSSTDLEGYLKEHREEEEKRDSSSDEETSHMINKPPIFSPATEEEVIKKLLETNPHLTQQEVIDEAAKMLGKAPSGSKVFVPVKLTPEALKTAASKPVFFPPSTVNVKADSNQHKKRASM